MKGRDYIFVVFLLLRQSNYTALIWAAAENKKEIAIALIEAGADLNLQDKVFVCMHYSITDIFLSDEWS